MTHSSHLRFPDLDQPAVSTAPARSLRASKRCAAKAMMAILSARGTPARSSALANESRFWIGML